MLQTDLQEENFNTREFPLNCGLFYLNMATVFKVLEIVLRSFKASDFYAKQLLYNFEQRKTVFCLTRFV